MSGAKLTTPFEIERFSIPNPDIADALVVRAREVLIDGKQAGRVSLIASENGAETKLSEGMMLAVWTDNESQSAVIDPSVAHYTGQAELASGAPSSAAMNSRRVLIASAATPTRSSARAAGYRGD